MQRKVIRGIVRYSVSTATAAVIVAVYFRWLHVNETTVAVTFLVGILLVAANWGLRHSIYVFIAYTAPAGPIAPLHRSTASPIGTVVVVTKVTSGFSVGGKAS